MEPGDSVPRSSSREVIIFVVCFGRDTLPQKRVKGHYWGT